MSTGDGSKGAKSHDIAAIAKQGLDALLWCGADLLRRAKDEKHDAISAGVVNSLVKVWGEIFKVCGIGTTIYFQERKESVLEELSRILSEAEKDEK